MINNRKNRLQASLACPDMLRATFTVSLLAIAGCGAPAGQDSGNTDGGSSPQPKIAPSSRTTVVMQRGAFVDLSESARAEASGDISRSSSDASSGSQSESQLSAPGQGRAAEGTLRIVEQSSLRYGELQGDIYITSKGSPEALSKSSESLTQKGFAPGAVSSIAAGPSATQSRPSGQLADEDEASALKGIKAGISPDLASEISRKSTIAVEQAEKTGATSVGRNRIAVFSHAPGFAFKVSPPQPVEIVVETRAGSRTLTKSVDNEGLFAISMLRFAPGSGGAALYPPAFRERYTMTIRSIKGAMPSASFSYKFSFAIRSDATSLSRASLSAEGARAFRFATDMSLNLLEISRGDNCLGCTFEVSGAGAALLARRVAELPFIPAPTRLGITFPPKRFSGLLSRTESTPLKVNILGNKSSQVTLQAAVAASSTSEGISRCPLPGTRLSDGCPVRRNGALTKSYFGFLLTVPRDLTEGSFGGVQGYAEALIEGTARVKTLRDGVVVEDVVVPFSSGVISGLDDVRLPGWALEDLKSAIYSGSPEF